MRTILDMIDEMIDAGHQVFLHCLAGRGRTGAVIGCWLARHGIATGEAAIDELSRLRYRCGLFTPSPETETQRRLVTSWKEGE